MTGTIVQISSSKGGVPKLPMLEAVIGELGIEGDAVANADIHGGPEQAVCLFSAERIDALVAEGHPISPGSTGENITIRGIDWDLVVPKTRLQLGDEVVLEITRQMRGRAPRACRGLRARSRLSGRGGCRLSLLGGLLLPIPEHWPASLSAPP
jgi:MOSC domain-containing protein YiiM